MATLDSLTDVIYSSRIIKATALLSDTKTLLVQWDDSLTVSENLARFREDNIFGKASRSRIEDILPIFRQRYLDAEPTRKALILLAKAHFPAEALEKSLFFHSTQADALLHDAVTKILVPLREDGNLEITVQDVRQVINNWMLDGKTTSRWSDSTLASVVQHLMSTLRDFGILEGAAKKRLASIYLPLEAFAYIAFYLYQLQPSGEKLLHHPDWQLFFLTVLGVERLFVEAHQRHLLEYYAAGSIIRIDFPAASLEEYARVILERTF